MMRGNLVCLETVAEHMLVHIAFPLPSIWKDQCIPEPPQTRVATFTWVLSNHLQNFRAFVSVLKARCICFTQTQSCADKDLWMMGRGKIQRGYKAFLLFFSFHISLCVSSQSLKLRKPFCPAHIHISPQGLHRNQQDSISKSYELRIWSRVCWSWLHVWTVRSNLETEYFMYSEGNCFVLIWREEC